VQVHLVGSQYSAPMQHLAVSTIALHCTALHCTKHSACMRSLTHYNPDNYLTLEVATGYVEAAYFVPQTD
jgi:hypothetical protein